MAKPEWGTKRTCLSCGARYYDFGRSPIVCPACGAVFDLESASRARRARPAVRVADEEVAAAPEEVDLADEGGAGLADDTELEEAEETPLEEPAEDEEEDVLIEDTADLGEDEDMSDVIEGEIDEDNAHR